ncbi:hypothetical protein [Hyalangium versicolor]|uniref:hypothetical protein n=1 Tax=Hyalangium versicolor TaxID=2861190 RepID=UPI001CCE8697|nr:hypothetical protein [Hyalangium versicolor]
MRWLLLMGALMFSSCLRSAGVPSAPLEDNKSIVFPMFFGEEGMDVGGEGKPSAMDGATLRALMVATQDFLPSNAPGKPCWSTPEGHRYGIIRQGDIVFIEISADFSNCWHEFMPLDYGAVYAIGMDGRILRRLFVGHPDYPTPPRLSSDAGVSGPKDDRDYSDLLGYTGRVTENRLIPNAGSRVDGGVQNDGGAPTPPDP